MTYAHAADRNFMAAYYIGVQLFKFVLTATLTLLVSRRRSKVAMWVSIALFASIVVATLVVDITIGRTTDIITLAVLISQGVAYGLLFTPSARRWVSRKDEKNEKLREVFE
jgi:predicted membrane channel-forming protein YqfA (hemolysin III family)